jgi:hypothetical protein
MDVDIVGKEEISITLFLGIWPFSPGHWNMTLLPRPLIELTQFSAFPLPSGVALSREISDKSLCAWGFNRKWLLAECDCSPTDASQWLGVEILHLQSVTVQLPWVPVYLWLYCLATNEVCNTFLKWTPDGWLSAPRLSFPLLPRKDL